MPGISEPQSEFVTVRRSKKFGLSRMSEAALCFYGDRLNAELRIFRINQKFSI